MKKTSLILSLCLAATGLQAQVVKVHVGEITYVHSAADAGDMTFTGGTQLTVQGKTYRLTDVSSVEVGPGSVTANTVSVDYEGASARVTVSGDLAAHVTATATGADVSIIADSTYTGEIIYTLTGTSTDGSFYMDGDAKARLVLDVLTLTNKDGGAITIDNGKRIAVDLAGNSTLTDGPGSQRACFFINGHTEINGNGKLTINGNARHGFFSDEYAVVNGGTIVVTSAPSDGMHVNQYFRLNKGDITIKATGDGLDVGKKNKITEGDNGMIFINGGSLNITATGEGSKGIKADSTVTITGGQVASTVTGSAFYDTTKADISSCAALKPGGVLTISGGTVTATATGAGGKAINADHDIVVTAGTVTALSYGELYSTTTDDTKPHAIKSDGNITIDGGEVYAAAASDDGRAISTDFNFLINGGTVMGIGGKKCEPTGGRQGYKSYKGVNVRAGQTVSYDGVSYAVPSDFSHSGARVLVSKAGM